MLLHSEQCYVNLTIIFNQISLAYIARVCTSTYSFLQSYICWELDANTHTQTFEVNLREYLFQTIFWLIVCLCASFCIVNKWVWKRVGCKNAYRNKRHSTWWAILLEYLRFVMRVRDNTIFQTTKPLERKENELCIPYLCMIWILCPQANIAPLRLTKTWKSFCEAATWSFIFSIF